MCSTRAEHLVANARSAPFAPYIPSVCTNVACTCLCECNRRTRRSSDLATTTGHAPQVSSSSRPRWERIPPKNCFYYRSARANSAYVLSFVFVFDREADKYAFAYSYPFTYTHQQRLLAEVIA